jgi:C4-dicarboxylate-specific signal transduction histidine kinase
MRGVRLILLLDAVAVGTVVGGLLLVVGLPLAAAGALGPRRLLLLVAVGVVAAVAVGAALLFRAVARPVDRMIGAAERLAVAGRLPVLETPGLSAGGLEAGAIAFERLAGALAAEQSRLATKVAELEGANASLAQAREELLRSERLATVGQLAAGIAHEIGNPLGAIAGYAELARSKLAGGSEVEDFVRRIGIEAGRIDAIVRDLLDFARPAPLELGPVALAAAVDGAIRLARIQTRCRGLEVSLDLPADLPPVLADERRLAQVFLNLFLNAGDAMGGGGRLDLSARVEAGRVLVTLRDHGPGLAPEILPSIFDPFFTTKPTGQGTGLGLAVCHGIIASFGGQLSASNAHGGGAVFRIEFAAA